MRAWLISTTFLVACSSSGLPGDTGTTGGGTTGGGTTGGNPGTSCGGKRGSQCASDEYCDYPAESPCGNFDVPGTCKKRPQGCTADYSPVCGCDYITYSNACSANGAGVDVGFTGACEAPPPPTETCGSIAGVQCGPTSYCYYTPGGMCDWADGSGTCKERPQVCDDLYAPVCGCDQKTYDNECIAASAGVGVAYTGACSTPTKDCRDTGCPTGKTCQLCWTSYQCLDPNVAC